MFVKFADLVSTVIEKLQQKNVQVEDITDLVAEKHGCSLYEDTDMTKLFQLLKRNKCLTFFSHDVLVDIIDAFGDEKCQLSLKQFKAKFQTYCRNRITEIPKSEWSKLGLESKSDNNCCASVKLSFKIDESFKALTLERLATFGEHIARALGVDKSALHLMSVEEGCIQVTYLIPAHVIDIVRLHSSLFSDGQGCDFMSDTKVLSTKISICGLLSTKISCSVSLVNSKYTPTDRLQHLVRDYVTYVHRKVASFQTKHSRDE